MQEVLAKFKIPRQMGILPLCLLALSGSPAIAQAQSDKGVTLSGSIQSDMLIPQNDEAIGAKKTDDFVTNTYADLMLQSKYVDAGVRLEYLEHPLPGFDPDFKGWGVPDFWVKGKLGAAELTAGTFYEQFGSGFILRTYEERSLGIDNSLLGGRLVLKPAKGVTVKALSGVQRRFWKWNKSLVSGADAEVNLDEWIPSMQSHDVRLTVGGSWVNKHEKPDDDILVNNADLRSTYRISTPRFVNAWDVRAALNVKDWSLLAEYAQKTDDPSYYNGYIFKKGNAAMLSASYSHSGLSVLLQAKRSENMASVSRRKENSTYSASTLNHLPAFTLDHTYALAAFYPYATQLTDGEWAYQAEVAYNFKRKTPLGGKYGMNVKVNFSYVRSIDRDFIDGTKRSAIAGQMALAGTDGYKSSFFKWGDHTYYQDLDITVTRKLSRDFKLTVMYMNQRYNQQQIQQHGGMVHTNIFVADGLIQLAPKTRLRCEVQYMQTKQDYGDWLYGLAELSLAPHWMLTVSDMWNVGDSDPNQYAENTHYHYYQALVTYNVGAHRIQLGYGRTREGINCSGGVCRKIPAQKGFTLSYNYNF